MGRAPRRRLLVALVAGLGLVMSGCARHAPQDTLKPAGSAARSIDHLFTGVFFVAVLFFILVEGGILFIILRYRHRDDRPEPVQVHGNTRLEVGWTIVPALILLVVGGFTFKVLFDLNRTPTNPLRVTVIGHQFWWEYRYTDLGIVTANEIHFPVKKPVRLTLKGADVIHSFWIPRLAGKHDVEPGRTSQINVEADKPGVYLGQCVEFCGLSHANMRLRAFAQTASDFDGWVTSQKAGPVPPASGSDAEAGFTLFTSKGCAGCHTVNGVSNGQIGPNLTHVYSRTAFAGDTFDMTPDNLRKWLHDPPGVKPGAKMPNLHLSSDEITKLIAYLETLK